MEEVRFHRALMTGVTIHTEKGPVKSNYELITGIEVLGMGKGMELNWPGRQKYVDRELVPQKQAMTKTMARRLLDFCRLTVAVGNDDYDCHSFVSFLMGWQNDAATGRKRIAVSGQPIRNFANTEANCPYIAHVPGAKEEPYPHSFFGTRWPGYGLSVISAGMPLVMSRTTDLKRVYGATQLWALRRRDLSY